MLPVIAIVGRPNVGKSTLFNQLTRSRDALVADRPGLTRDRQYGRGRLGPAAYIIVDTGGLTDETDAIDELMAQQTRAAIEESDLVLFMVDARDGQNSADEAIIANLRRYNKPVQLVMNKIDGINVETATNEFYSLGCGEPIAIAAAQNRGINQMMEAILAPFIAVQDDSAALVSEDGTSFPPHTAYNVVVAGLAGGYRQDVWIPGATPAYAGRLESSHASPIGNRMTLAQLDAADENSLVFITHNLTPYDEPALAGNLNLSPVGVSLQGDSWQAITLDGEEMAEVAFNALIPLQAP